MTEEYADVYIRQKEGDRQGDLRGQEDQKKEKQVNLIEAEEGRGDGHGKPKGQADETK